MFEDTFVLCIKDEFTDCIRKILLQNFGDKFPVRNPKFVKALQCSDLVTLKEFLWSDCPVDSTYEKAFSLARDLMLEHPNAYGYIMECQNRRCVKQIVEYGIDNDIPALVIMALNTTTGIHCIEQDERVLYKLRKHVKERPLPDFVKARMKSESFILKQMIECYSV